MLDRRCKNANDSLISDLPLELRNRILLHTVGIDNRLALRVPLFGRVRAPPGFEEKIARRYANRVHGKLTGGRLFTFSFEQHFIQNAAGQWTLLREQYTEYVIAAGLVTAARQYTSFEPASCCSFSGCSFSRRRWVQTGRVTPDPKIPDLHSYPCKSRCLD